MNPLKYLIALLVFVPICNESNTVIGTGIFTDDIVVWRFYENIEGVFTPKLLLINTGDSAISVDVEIVNSEGKKLRPSLISSKKLNPNEYVVTTLAELPGPDDYLSFLIGDKKVGFLEALYYSPPQDLKPLKYFSFECLNGREDEFWMSKNTLISKDISDTLILHLNYFDRVAYAEPGEQMLEIHHSKQIGHYETVKTSSTLQVENLNEKLYLKLPYRPLSNSNTQVDLRISVETDETTLLNGIEAEFILTQPDKNGNMVRSNYISNPLNLPILIIR